MSDFLFSDYSPQCPARPMIESKRIFDVRDPKWGHPEFRGLWVNPEVGENTLNYMPERPSEVKRAADEYARAYFLKMFEGGKLHHTCDIECVTVPGCPEEPEAEVDVYVYKPKTLKESGNRAMLFLSGGGFVLCFPEFWAIDRICDEFNCVAIMPMHRCSYEATYPAAVNDCHAAYQWAVENAESLKIDPDNFVVTGSSTGAHLSLAMGFRLKRYGYIPKGIVACLPQTDDRTYTNIYTGTWDSVCQRLALKQWLGENDNSNFIGPEALANKATVADCVGYPPCFIHTVEFDPDRDANRELYGKMLKARTYAEYHAWGGAMHETIGIIASAYMNGMDDLIVPYSERFKSVIYDNIRDCYQYDLRRPWVAEELKENGPWW